MNRVAITGIGVKIPEAEITNEQLVASFNEWVGRENKKREKCGKEPLPESSVAFIEHASGVKSRHVISADGVLDPERMTPRIPRRDNDEVSVMAEFGLASARQAIDDAGIDAVDID